MGDTAWSVVDRQLEAYEAGDLDAFLACFAADATVRSLADGSVLCADRAAIETQYAPLLAGEDGPTVEVHATLSVGQFVAVDEQVGSDDGTTRALAVYRAEDDAIVDLQLGYPD